MEINRLPSGLRTDAAIQKYADAVELYANSDMSISCIAEKCGVSPYGLSAHIAKHHRQLLFARYGIDPNNQDLLSIKVKPPRGQSMKTHLKYKDAIEACGDIAYIEFNVSQVARMFNVNGSALAAQMRVHYPDIIPARENLRQKLGIADNTHRGARPWCVDIYTKALELYRDSDMTIEKVAQICDISKSGFGQFMRFYHHDVIRQKANARKAAKREVGDRLPGNLAGNGNTYGPKPETVELYAPAIELLRSSSMTIKEIAEKTGVPEAGFKGYLNQWHRNDKITRPGNPTADKYAPAIESLSQKPRPVAEVAEEFGLNPEVFRAYLKAHHPQLTELQGMTRLENGKLVKRSSAEKYAYAIREYATSPEPLKDIAKRHGIVYNSLSSYVKRNCPEESKSHQAAVEKHNRQSLPRFDISDNPHDPALKSNK